VNNQLMTLTDNEQKIADAFGLNPEADVLWNWISAHWKAFLFRQRIHAAGVRLLITVTRH
jgi:hypothetical protein